MFAQVPRRKRNHKTSPSAKVTKSNIAMEARAAFAAAAAAAQEAMLAGAAAGSSGEDTPATDDMPMADIEAYTSGDASGDAGGGDSGIDGGSGSGEPASGAEAVQRFVLMKEEGG